MTITIQEVRDVIESAETMADMDSLQNDVALTEQDVDSLDLANILLLLEERFDVKIPDEDTNQLQTVNGIVEYLNNK